MARQDIFEILNNKYNIEKEFRKVNDLLKIPFIQYYNYQTPAPYNMTLEQTINQKLLLYWKQRKSYFSCEEMKADIDFQEENFTIENILKALEYYANLIYLVQLKTNTQFNTNYQFHTEYYYLIQNIDILLEHLSYQKYFIPNEEKVILIPNKPEVNTVAEISTKETALAILKYNHLSLKGDLDEKRKLLYQIALEYEPLLKTPIENYKDFFKKTNELLNTLHIRHNNITKENNKNNVINLATEELENLYDELYQLLLFCILIKDNTDRKNRVANFLQKIKEANAENE